MAHLSMLRQRLLTKLLFPRQQTSGKPPVPQHGEVTPRLPQLCFQQPNEISFMYLFMCFLQFHLLFVCHALPQVRRCHRLPLVCSVCFLLKRFVTIHNTSQHNGGEKYWFLIVSFTLVLLECLLSLVRMTEPLP